MAEHGKSEKQAGAHDDGHHDHGLPPPEPDHVKALGIFAWGFGTFALVVAVILWLGGYFWIERDAEDLVKVHQSFVAPEILQARKDAREHLRQVRKLENGRYQVPITQAMALVAEGK